MKIGLISKPEHCRPHAKALKALGVKVEVFGGDPGLTIPSRVDALVVRTCSISHSAFAIAKTWERDGGTVFYVEGAKKAAKAVKEWMDMTLRNLIGQMMDKYGWAHWYVLCKWSPEDRKAIGYVGYEKGIASLNHITPSGVRTAILSQARERKWRKSHLSAANGGSPGRPVQVWAGPDADPKTLNAFSNLAAQKKAGKDHKYPDGVTVPEYPLSADNIRNLLNVPVSDASIEPEEKPTTPKKTTPKSDGAETKVQCESNTQALLEVMSDMETLEGRLEALREWGARGWEGKQTLENRVECLESRVQCLEDRSVGVLSLTAIEERISVLEESRGPAKSQSTNPFAVIEDFKRKLSASGFRGTLTLTVGEDG